MTSLEGLMEAAARFTTPVPVVDDQVRHGNLARMQGFAAELGVRLRPHAKTHKSLTVARQQIQCGAVGLTVATMQEAETFATQGDVQDLLLAHPPVGEPTLSRLRQLSGSVARLAVAIDTVSVAAALPESVEVLWEIDTGLQRLGTQPGEPTVRAVRELLRTIGPDRFRGLMTHGGHAYRAADDAQLLNATAEETGGLTSTADRLRAEGIEVRELSIGSTPTTRYLDRVSGATEIRPGTYVYGDATQVQLGSQAIEDCALAVIATVVSTPEPRRAVVDAGSKALSGDLAIPRIGGFGIVLGYPSMRVDRLSEEHGVVIADAPTGLHVGDRIAIVPSHACTTVNLHSELLIVDASGQTRWELVDARGWRDGAT